MLARVTAAKTEEVFGQTGSFGLQSETYNVGTGNVAQESACLAFFLPGFDSQHRIKLGLMVHACNLSI